VQFSSAPFVYIRYVKKKGKSSEIFNNINFSANFTKGPPFGCLPFGRNAVIYYPGAENRKGGIHTGRVNEKIIPPRCFFRQARVPPSSAASFLEMASPSPACPSFFVVTPA
jgi:hypothetical protein